MIFKSGLQDLPLEVKNSWLQKSSEYEPFKEIQNVRKLISWSIFFYFIMYFSLYFCPNFINQS